MSYIAEYKHGIIDEDEYRFYANRENREERDAEREMDYEQEEEEDDEGRSNRYCQVVGVAYKYKTK